MSRRTLLWRLGLAAGVLSVVSFATFLDAHPTSALVAGHSANCARSVPSGPPPHNPWKPAMRRLAPINPARIRLCKYTTRFVRGVVLTENRTDSLVEAFNELRPTPPNHKGFTSCFFNADPIVAHSDYPGGHSVTIYVPTNCTSASNGDLTRSWPPSALKHLRNQLIHLTH